MYCFDAPHVEAPLMHLNQLKILFGLYLHSLMTVKLNFVLYFFYLLYFASGPQPGTSSGSRVLVGGRAWAGATATPLSVSKLEALCTPCEAPPGAPPGPSLAPLQRFLACVYMKRTLQRFVQQEDYVSIA